MKKISQFHLIDKRKIIYSQGNLTILKGKLLLFHIIDTERNLFCYNWIPRATIEEATNKLNQADLETVKKKQNTQLLTIA